jgi:hypothetical protein
MGRNRWIAAGPYTSGQNGRGGDGLAVDSAKIAFMSRRILAYSIAVLAASLPTATSVAEPQTPNSTEKLPPVYFNDFDLVLDPAAYDAIAQSPFLKNEFSGFMERTATHEGSQGSYTITFLGVRGRQSYLAFFKPSERLPMNQIQFQMWIDDRMKLPLIRDSLARQTHTDPTLRPSARVIDGRSINQIEVTAANFPVDPENVRAKTWVAALYPDYLRQRYPDIKPEQEGTTREKLEARNYVPERLMNDITRFTFTVDKTETDQLMQEFRAYGYAIHKDGEKQIAKGPEIEFVLVNAEPRSGRKVAVDMKLNRAKTGDQVYRFGTGSELRLKGDTATWYFPAGWRP